ncbi:uncharacterized protein LOC131074783 [Cryptomeria japonica]|uniref:uncharacterized protein LOC131074783 n=1 Tax=Cryptomeria japonica TaxID=3369 RepID=UPI0027DA2EA6|nr:uncharacterized protein LOC131074783 [Cryptomeria japonica]
MHDIHQQVKETLQKSVERYKENEDLRKRDVQFKVGDLVFAYLRKERLPKGKYTKLMKKKIGPCKAVHKFGQNAYEIELPPGVAISPIFNIADLYPFKGFVDVGEEVGATGIKAEEWVKDLPPSHPMKVECILDTRALKRTRKKVYNLYLAKWHNLPNKDATWMKEEDIKQHRALVQELISIGA